MGGSHLGKSDTARQHAIEAIARLKKGCKHLPASTCDVMHGRAGALLAVWFLRQELGDMSLGRDFAVATSRSILIEGMQQGQAKKCDVPLVWKFQGKTFLGAAFGVVGILHSILGHT